MCGIALKNCVTSLDCHTSKTKKYVARVWIILCRNHMFLCKPCEFVGTHIIVFLSMLKHAGYHLWGEISHTCEVVVRLHLCIRSLYGLMKLDDRHWYPYLIEVLHLASWFCFYLQSWCVFMCVSALEAINNYSSHDTKLYYK